MRQRDGHHDPSRSGLQAPIKAPRSDIGAGDAKKPKSEGEAETMPTPVIRRACTICILLAGLCVPPMKRNAPGIRLPDVFFVLAKPRCRYGHNRIPA